MPRHKATDEELPEVVREFLAYLTNELKRSPLTVSAYRSDLTAYINYLTGNKPKEFSPETVTTNDIRTWIAVSARSGKGMSTLRRGLQSLRSFFLFLKRRHIIFDDPSAPIELPSRRHALPEYVTEEEMETLLKDLPSDPSNDFVEFRDKLILDLLYSTGMRQAELLSLRDSDFKTSGNLRITGKGDKQRVVPIAKELMRQVKEYCKMRDKEFPELPEGHRFLVHRGRHMSKSKLYSIVRTSLEGTSSRKKSPHVLRHTFATAMINGGADINTVKEFLGHSSLATTQIYTHVSFKDMKKSYDNAHPRSTRRRQ